MDSGLLAIIGFVFFIYILPLIILNKMGVGLASYGCLWWFLGFGWILVIMAALGGGSRR
jgi:hypothetical protein